MRVLLLFTLLAALCRADLTAVKAEPSLERRAELALDNAERTLELAKQASMQADFAKVEPLLAEFASSCELALASLRETGKRPNKLAKSYKRSELRTRQFLRRLEGVVGALNFEDRAKAETYKDRATGVHEELLLGAMARN